MRGATLIGSGPEVLRTIDRVGSDLGFALGTCGKDGQGVPVSDAQPTLRIPELTVGGTETGRSWSTKQEGWSGETFWASSWLISCRRTLFRFR